MVAVSIVIITKSLKDILGGCLQKAKLITDDIIIVETNSNDTGISSNNHQQCRILQKTWEGYGANKNKGAAAAKYEWILSIDADEIPDDALIFALHKLDYSNPAVVYDIKFRAYLGNKPVRFGSWGKDHHIRLFNRTRVSWHETTVHETLMLPEDIQIRKTEGYIHHYSAKDVEEYQQKNRLYAKLSAAKYFNNGKKAGVIKLYLSPAFGFVKNYIFYFGFLDGRAGWQIAKATMQNTRLKYHLLQQLLAAKQPAKIYPENFMIEINPISH